MTGSPSFLASWIDRDFWRTGAFLSSSNGDHITLGKGGRTQLIEGPLAFKTPTFLLKDFFEKKYLAYTPDSFVTVSRANFLSYLKSLSDVHDPISPLSNDDDLYEKDFKLLQGAFNKSLRKVVLVSRETYGSFEAERSIQRLVRKAVEFAVGIPYGKWSEGQGIVGSTPELLFSLKDRKLSTFALAGTARQGQEQELLNSPKDLEEHALVVQDIQEKLSPYIEEIKTGETHVTPFKKLIHLKTNLEGKLKDIASVENLINALSPTAALGGYPMKDSLRFLTGTHYFQKYSTRYFGSAFGLYNGNEQEFIVAIRNVQWEGQHLFIESGGGVLPNSDFQKELAEIHLKRNTIRSHYL